MIIQNCSVTENIKTDRILELAKKCGWEEAHHSMPSFFEKFYKLAHQDGQRSMQERAAKECEAYSWWYAVGGIIRNLEIEGESFIQKNEPATFLSMVFGD